MAKQQVKDCMLAGWALLGGVHFAGLAARLETGDVLGAGERQQIAQLRGIHKVSGLDGQRAAGFQTAHPYGAHLVTLDIRGHGLVAQQNGEAAAAREGRQHLLQHGERDARLVSEARDCAVTRIQVPARARFGGEGVVAAIEIAHRLAVSTVGARTAKAFNPGVFVRRHGLGGELASNPVRLLGHDHPHAVTQRCQSRGAATHTAAGDGDIAGQPGGAGQARRRGQQAQCPAEKFPS
jgi:hypothetical protein